MPLAKVTPVPAEPEGQPLTHFPTIVQPTELVLQRNHARVYLNVAQLVGNAVETLINFDTVEFDPGGIWDLVNKRFVVRQPGIYRAMGATSSAVSTNTYCVLYVNGAMARRGSQPNPGFGSQVSDLISLLVGATVDLRFLQASGGNANLSAGAHLTWLSLDYRGVA